MTTTTHMARVYKRENMRVQIYVYAKNLHIWLQAARCNFIRIIIAHQISTATAADTADSQLEG